jgi:hypothetical protein
MEQNNKSGMKRVVFSLLSLYSMSIYAVVLTAVLYILRGCTNLGIEMGSFFHAFVFVAVVTMLNPLAFLIEFTMSIMSEILAFVPKIAFLFVSKVAECLLLIWIVGKVDGAVDAVQLSLYAQLTFAFAVHIITTWMTGSGYPAPKAQGEAK